MRRATVIFWARFPTLKEHPFSFDQNPWVLGQGMAAKLQRKQDKLNHQLTEIQKEAEAKQKQENLESGELFNNPHAHLGPQVNAIESPLVEVTSQPQPLFEDTLTTISTSSTPCEITPLTVIGPTSVFEERLQELLHLQQANLEETMERRFLVECLETNLMIKNTLESSLKSFNDFVLFNMNLLMQQRMPPSVQPPPLPQPTIPPSTTTTYLVPTPSPSPPKSPPTIPQPPFTKG